MKSIVQLIATALTIVALPQVLSGLVVENFGAAVLGAFVLALLNTVIRPILVILTFPITLLTIGLFYFVLNALMFQFMGALVSGVRVDSFWTALAASLVVSFVSWIFSASQRKTSFRSQGVVFQRGGRPMKDLN